MAIYYKQLKFQGVLKIIPRIMALASKHNDLRFYDYVDGRVAATYYGSDHLGAEGGKIHHFTTNDHSEYVRCHENGDLYLEGSKPVVDKGAKYMRTITERSTGATIQADIYDVLEAWGVTCPSLAHALKKAMMPGSRGGKGFEKDMREAMNSMEIAIQLEKNRESKE